MTNIADIPESNILMTATNREGGAILYKIDEPNIKYIVHSFMKNGECHGGGYFNATQLIEAKDEWLRKVSNMTA